MGVINRPWTISPGYSDCEMEKFMLGFVILNTKYFILLPENIDY
jgi:hypothetical protein